MATTLLDKARRVPTRKGGPPVTDEEIDLCLAWARGEIIGAQAGQALGVPQGTFHARAAAVLATAVRRGRLVEAKR